MKKLARPFFGDVGPSNVLLSLQRYLCLYILDYMKRAAPGYDRISDEDSAQPATNFLTIAPRTIAGPSGVSENYRQALKKHYVSTTWVNMKNIWQMIEKCFSVEHIGLSNCGLMKFIFYA